MLHGLDKYSSLILVFEVYNDMNAGKTDFLNKFTKLLTRHY